MKPVEAGRTRTEVVRTDGDTRVDDVADMIAGAAHATARAESRRLPGSH